MRRKPKPPPPELVARSTQKGRMAARSIRFIICSTYRRVCRRTAARLRGLSSAPEAMLASRGDTWPTRRRRATYSAVKM